MRADLSKKFIRNILCLHGNAGAEWIDGLPQLVREIELTWSLRVEKPFTDLSYHFVAPCVCADAGEAVLKIGFPEEKSPLLNEARVLRIFGGRGAVKLLREDKKRFALLLEKLTPGEDLRKLCDANDERATDIAIGVLHALRPNKQAGGGFPLLENWAAGLRTAEQAKFAPRLVKKARGFFDELIASSGKSRLLHGDFHHQNILSATRRPFVAIDPKGIFGDIGYEISVFLNNPRSWILSQPDAETILKKRVGKFSAAFEIRPEDLQKWAFAEAVLSAWWTFEDGGGREKWLACARIWESFKI